MLTPARVGAVPVDALRSSDGLEVMRRIISGELPTPPIARVLPFTLSEADHGRAVFVGTPGAQLYNPMGTVHGGFAMTLLDSAMTSAIMTTLAAGQGTTTVETKVSFVRPLSAETGPVRAEGRVVHVGARIATAEGRLVDAGGRLYAHGTTTCLVFSL